MRAIRVAEVDIVSAAEQIMAKVKNHLPEIIGLARPHDVLVAIWVRPEKTAGGLYLTDRQRDEDVFQGKTGLVLRIGELAYEPDESHQWPERTPDVGDWVAFRVSDGWPFYLGEQPCRMIDEAGIRMILSKPDVVL